MGENLINALVREAVAAAIAEALGGALGAETLTIGAPPRKASASPAETRRRYAATGKAGHACTGDADGVVHGFLRKSPEGTPCYREGCTGTIRGEAVAAAE